MAISASGAIRVDGVEVVIENLAGYAAKFRDLSVPVRRSLIALDAQIKHNFEAQGSDDGPWIPTSSKTMQRRQRGGYNITQTLVVTGALRRDWDFQVDRGHGVLKSAHFYSTYHEKGGPHLPVRRITPTPGKQYEIVQREFARYLDEVLG